MTKIKLILLSFLFFSIAPTAFAAEAYLGQFIYKYKGGDTYRVTVSDSKIMKWECIEGTEKGAIGIENPQRFKANDKVYFVTWVEKTGIYVSQMVDLKNMKVFSTIIDGKERYVVEGIISREK